jgi:hypothetical protein
MTDYDKMMEVTGLTECARRLQAGSEAERKKFRDVFGVEPGVSARELRRIVSEKLGLSETKAAQLNHISKSLQPELMEKFESGEIGVSVANAAASLPAEEQEHLAKKNKISIADVTPKKECQNLTQKPQREPCQNLTQEKPEQTPAKLDEGYQVPGQICMPECQTPAAIIAENPENRCENAADEPEHYNRRILQEMIREAENTFSVMKDYWKMNQPSTYTRYIMELQALSDFLAAHKDD